MKHCNGCNQTRPLTDFSKCARSPDGFNWRCRQCTKEAADKYRFSRKGKDARQTWYEENKSRGADRKRVRRQKYAKDNPLEVRARLLLGNAVRSGYIARPELGEWRNRWEFHHPDHNRPYYGCWVRPSEHRLIDNGRGKCPPCTDYTQQVLSRLLTDWGLDEHH